jgi:hypothetical protein
MKKLTNLEIRDTDNFNKAVKKLKKRFRNIEKDYTAFVDSIKSGDDLGIHLGDNIYKARIANSDKNSGKSGGYRLITYLKLVENELYLLFIYDKSDFENISENEIDSLIMNAAKGK